MVDYNIKRVKAQDFQSKSRDILDSITQDKTSFVVTRNLKECAIIVPYSEESYQELMRSAREKVSSEKAYQEFLKNQREKTSQK